jgi:hypothetical protein
METRDLKNIVGRAGRSGKETKGLVIVTNEPDFALMKQVINDRGSRNITGYLYKISKIINEYIIRNRLVLSNELLEEQEEWFKKLIDSIDISIIDLLAEEMQVDQLADYVNALVEKTFAFNQSNDQEKEVLKEIFKLRGDALKPYVENLEYKFIKMSGSSIRLYKDITQALNLDDTFWTTNEDLLSEKWISFLKDVVLELPQIKFEIEEFNKRNRENITKENISEIIELWVRGNLYKEISDITGLQIDIILKLFSSLISYQIQNILSSIVRTVDNKLLEKDLHLAESIYYWPLYMLYGLHNRLQLDLIELGFSNRIAIIAFSKIIQKDNFEYDELKKLKKYIKQNAEKLIKKIEGTIPQISLAKMEENIEYL